MTSIENLNIEKLEKSDSNPGKKLEKSELKSYFNDKFFEDLKNGNVEIKKYKTPNPVDNKWIYIIEQKDKSGTRISDNGDYIKKFCVKETILNDYLKYRQNKEKTTLESDTLLKEFFNTINTKGELGELADNINNTESLKENPENLIGEIDGLMDWFKENRRRPRAPKLSENKHSKARFKQIIKDDLASLRSIKRELKKYTYTTNTDYFVDYIEKMKTHKEQLEKVRQIVSTGGNTAEIPAMLDSLKDVKRESLFQNTAAEYNFNMNVLMQDLTCKKLWNKDAEGFQEYLEMVWSGEIEHPEQDKFYTKHKKDFEEIRNKNPGLYGDITTKRDRYYNPAYATGGYNQSYRNQPEVCRRKKGAFDKGGDMFSDLLVKAGVIDENDTTKKAAWSKFGKIGLLALGAFAIYKIFTSKGKARRGWIGGSIGGLLALNNADKIKDWFGDAFGKKDADASDIMEQTNLSEDIGAQYITPQVTTLHCIGGIPIKTLVDGNMVEEKGGKFKLNSANYKAYIDGNTVMTSQEKKMNLDAMEKIKNDKSQTLLHTGLTSMGINSIKEFKNLAGNDPKTTLIDTPNVSNYFKSLSSPINAELETEGFKPTSPDAWYEMTSEYSGSKPSNAQILNRINKGYLKLADDSKYNLNDIMSHKEIKNLGDKTIKGFENSSGNLIKFNTYKELFDAAKLNEFIKNNFKGKTAVSTDPFHVDVSGNIEFDNAHWYEPWTNETNIINSNYFKNTLKNLSPTLHQYKDEYIKHLNARWKINGKVK